MAGTDRRSWHNAVLTYKTPIKVRGSKAAKDSRYKVKEELETRIENPGMVEAILKAAGLHPGFRYEKYRTTYRLPRLPRLAIDLDETPIGTFLELEGSRKAIDRVAAALGYAREAYSAASYWEVYRENCRRRGVPVGNMLFKRTSP
jgi:adenylate cyclase, class 2